MKHLRLLLLCALAAPALASAALFERTEDYQLPADQAVDGQFYLLSAAARLEGTLNDDAFLLAGTNLAFSGHARADTWMASSIVTFSGQADDHARLFGQTVTASGLFARDLYGLGTTVRLSTNSVVGGAAVLLGENVIVEGRVEGRLRILAQSATLSGALGGDVRILAQDIVVLPGTSIRGNLIYTSPKELFLDRNVQLTGQLIRETPQPAPAPSAPRRLLDGLVLTGLQWLAALLVGLPFLALFPRLAGRAARHIRFAPGRTLLTGLAGLFLLPVAAVFALFTVVGIPLGLLLGGFFAILIYLAKIIVGITLGSLLLRRRGAQPLSVVSACLALGLALLYGAAALPAIGASVALLIGIVGLGALLLSLLRGDGHPAVPPELPRPAPPPVS